MSNDKLKKELIRDEGYRLTSYQDSLGYWTIGIGHYLGLNRRMTTITRTEAEALFFSDVAEAERIVNSLITYEGYISDARRRALVNMAFNLGPRLGLFKKFIGHVNAGKWAAAAFEMTNSKWAEQVGNRAERLRDMIDRGTEV